MTDASYHPMLKLVEDAALQLGHALTIARERVRESRRNPCNLAEARAERDAIRTALKALGTQWACAEHY